MKKLLTLILAVAICLPLTLPSAVAAKTPLEDMDELDAIVSAYYYAGTIDTNSKKESDIVYITKHIPLYDLDNNIVAFYISFSSNCYAVVANNKKNPAVIEFGEGTSYAIENILKEDSSSRLIYNNPASVYSELTISSLTKSTLSNLMNFYDCYPEVLQPNETLSAQLQENKKKVLQSNAVNTSKGDGDYGFIYSSQMPTGNYTSNTIVYGTSVDWAKMSDYNDIASDHCGATTVTNLALYYARRSYSNLKIDGSKRKTFVAVHAIVGNGPIMTIAGRTVTYFGSRGYTVNYSGVDSYLGIKSATSSHRPCGILLADGVANWHWVLGVGWREYSSSSGFYVRINTNWYGHTNTYYKPGSGSTWWSASCYWL